MDKKLGGAKVEPFHSQPWWHGIGHNTDSTKWLEGTTIDLSTARHGNDNSATKIFGSQNMTSSLHDETESHELVRSDVASQQVILNGAESDQQHQAHVSSSTFSTSIECLAQSFRPDLLDNSIACGSYQQNSEPFYAGLVPTYISLPQHLQAFGVHSSRVVLPLEVAEEPVYVNAKQYHGILRRRQSRAKAELEKKAIRERRVKPYLHESRHQHALRRARGCGGRFLSTKNNLANSSPNPCNTKESNPGSRKANSTLQLGSSSSKLDPNSMQRTQFQAGISMLWQ